VSAALEAWYPGIRGGEAIANILFGDVNPSARLPLSFPRSEQDLPRPKLAEQPAAGEGDMVPFIPGTDFKVNSRSKFDVDYDEGLKVGYKWYEAEGKSLLFSFGFGLSYTTYTYSDLKASPASVTFNVKNTGSRAGVETAQVYVTLPAAAGEPFHRLVGWQKISLAPGETNAVTLALDPHYLSIFNAAREAWELVPGSYTVYAGGSSSDLPLHAEVQFAGQHF
jgi:beta-glucosidase